MKRPTLIELRREGGVHLVLKRGMKLFPGMAFDGVVDLPSDNGVSAHLQSPLEDRIYVTR